MSTQAGSMSNQVVVGVCGSKPSHDVLRWANFLAETTGSTLKVVIVWKHHLSAVTFGTGSWAGFSPQHDPAEEARRKLTATVDEVFGPTRPEGMTLTVREGGVAHALIKISDGARALVVGSRGHGGIVGLLHGSVSASCAEHAGCPVLVIRGTKLPPPKLVISEVPHDAQRIVAGIEGPVPAEDRDLAAAAKRASDDQLLAAGLVPN